MASGSITLKTESVNYDGSRGSSWSTMYNTINWSTSGTTITFSNGGRSGGNSWTLYASTTGTDYAAILEIQVSYNGGASWSTLTTRSTAIPTVAEGGLAIGAASDNMINSLGSYTLSGNCQVRALYYANREPAPTAQYPNAFPSKSYAAASNPSGVDVSVVVYPSGRGARDIIPLTNGFTGTVYVGSWGSGGNSNRYLELNVWPQGSVGSGNYLYKTQTIASESTKEATITASNDSKNANSSLTLVPNTIYSLGVYANNGAGAYTTEAVGDYTTLAEAATLTGTPSETSITLDYSTSADGGAYNKVIEYSLDGGTTWIAGATVTGGTAQTGSFIIPNLNSGTTYTIQTRTTTQAGSSDGATLTITTLSISNPKFYGSVKKEIVIGVEGEIRQGSSYIRSFDAETFWEAASSLIDPTKELDYLDVYMSKKGSVTRFLYLYYSDGTRLELIHAAQNVAEYNAFGLDIVEYDGQTYVDNYVDLTPITTPENVSKLIKKFYGPVEQRIISSLTVTFSNPEEDALTIDTDVLLQKIRPYLDFQSGEYEIELYFESSGSDYTLYFDYGGDRETMLVERGTEEDIAEYGIIIPDEILDTYYESRYILEATFTTGYATKLIKKLYGSVNGTSKLVYKA